MSAKPWLELWKANGDNVDRLGGGWILQGQPLTDGPPQPERAKLAAAAPMLARALCEVEWRGFAVDEANVCPARGCRGEEGKHSHSPDCALDAALTLAGLDAAAREEVRRGK